MGEGRGEYKVLVGRPEGDRPLGRPRRRWDDNIKMDLVEEIGRHGLDESVWGKEQVAVCCECGKFLE
jgi:hypothetical protein